MTPPRLDTHRHRGAPGPDKLAVAAHLVPDEHRLMKHHAVDGHCRASPLRALRRQTAAGKIHLREQPSAEDVTVRIGIAGIAMTRTSGSVAGTCEASFRGHDRFISDARGASVGDVNKISRGDEGSNEMTIGMVYTYSTLSEVLRLPRVEIPLFVHAKQSWLGRMATAASALATLAFIVVGAPRSVSLALR